MSDRKNKPLEKQTTFMNLWLIDIHTYVASYQVVTKSICLAIVCVPWSNTYIATYYMYICILCNIHFLHLRLHVYVLYVQLVK